MTDEEVKKLEEDYCKHSEELPKPELNIQDIIIRVDKEGLKEWTFLKTDEGLPAVKRTIQILRDCIFEIEMRLIEGHIKQTLEGQRIKRPGFREIILGRK